jgi:hypothetical protein
VGFVRWTEQRNFEAVLDMMADGRLDVKPLISHRFAIDDAEGLTHWWAGPGRRWAFCWSIRRLKSRRLPAREAESPQTSGTAADGAPASGGGAGGAVLAGFCRLRQLRDGRADPGLQGNGRTAQGGGVECRRQRPARGAQVRLRGNQHRYGGGDRRCGRQCPGDQHPPRQPCRPGDRGAEGRQACVRREAAVPDTRRAGRDRLRGGVGPRPA